MIVFLPFVLLAFLCGIGARFKGYSFLCWFMAMGIVGIVVIWAMPDAENNERQARRGNLIGLVMSALTLAGLFAVIRSGIL